MAELTFIIVYKNESSSQVKIWIYVNCLCVQVGVRPSGSTVSGCRCWAPYAPWWSCSCWRGGRPLLLLASSLFCWHTHSTRSQVNTHKLSHAHVCKNKAMLLLHSLSAAFRCELGLISAGELLQHGSEQVCRPQQRRGPRQELQVSLSGVSFCCEVHTPNSWRSTISSHLMNSLLNLTSSSSLSLPVLPPRGAPLLLDSGIPDLLI